MDTSKKATTEIARRLHDRICTGVEWLGSCAPRAVRDALLAKTTVAFARTDVAVLETLHRQVQALARSVGTSVDGVHVTRKLVGPPPAPESVPPPAHRWASVPRATPFPRLREHAPMRYPWGDEPPARPRSSSDVVPGKPDHLLSAGCRERLAAYWRSVAQQFDAGSEARQLHGRMRYHGPDEPPEWYWPADPD
jgi:hypothetical protein